MLLRVFRADVRRGHEATLFARLDIVVERESPKASGLHAVHVGRQMTDAGEKVVIASLWTDLASLQRSAGKDLDAARFLGADLTDLVEHVEVTHYEVVAAYPPAAWPPGA